MARPTRRTATDEAQVPTEAVTTEEPTVTEPAAESTPTEQPATEQPAASAEPDTSAFAKALADAIAEYDSTTGDVPEASIDAVKVAYRAQEGGLKGKNAARGLVDTAMKDAMEAMDIARARAYLNIQKQALVPASGSSGGTTRATREPVDPTEAFVQRVAALRLALNLATAEGAIPEGVAEDWADKAKALVAEGTESGQSLYAYEVSEDEDKGDAPEVAAWVTPAVRLALGRSAKVSVKRAAAKTGASGTEYTGPRRDVAKHILHAFEDLEVGAFLTVAEIRTKKSPEYGDDLPSSGAVAARLTPSATKPWNIPGIEPSVNEAGKKGARKVAVEG